MTEAEIALARRLVACSRWPEIAERGHHHGTAAAFYFREYYTGRQWVDVAPPQATDHEWLPDLNDPGTVGCVEALVQQALGHDGVSVVVEVRWTPVSLYRATRWTPGERGWGWTPHTIGGCDHPTKIAALVAALKAAP